MVLVKEIDILEILERAKSGGEIVDWTENGENVREEVLRRNAKAGYCNRDGSPIGTDRGNLCRPVDKKKYNKEYVRIFGHD